MKKNSVLTVYCSPGDWESALDQQDLYGYSSGGAGYDRIKPVWPGGQAPKPVWSSPDMSYSRRHGREVLVNPWFANMVNYITWISNALLTDFNTFVRF